MCTHPQETLVPIWVVPGSVFPSPEFHFYREPATEYTTRPVGLQANGGLQLSGTKLRHLDLCTIIFRVFLCQARQNSLCELPVRLCSVALCLPSTVQRETAREVGGIYVDRPDMQISGRELRYGKLLRSVLLFTANATIISRRL